MKAKGKLVKIALGVLVFTALAASKTPSYAQDEADVTPKEKIATQSFARLFVRQMIATRDIGALIKPFFADNFTDYQKQDYYEKVSPQLYARLNNKTRIRLFVAQENLSYLFTLILTAMPDSEIMDDKDLFGNIMPEEIANPLESSRLVEGVAEFTDYKELLKELVMLEVALVKARIFLSKMSLEQTALFKSTLARRGQDASRIGYRVRASRLDKAVKDKHGIIRFRKG
jgi:hypothetical protein